MACESWMPPTCLGTGAPWVKEGSAMGSLVLD